MISNRGIETYLLDPCMAVGRTGGRYYVSIINDRNEINATLLFTKTYLRPCHVLFGAALDSFHPRT